MASADRAQGMPSGGAAPQRPFRLLHAAASASIALAVLGTCAVHLATAGTVTQPHTPLQRPSDGYAGSDTCRACHPGEYASWHRSYHRTMTQQAGPHSVLGEFDGVQRVLDGRRYELVRREDRFFLRMDAPQGVAAGADGMVTLPITLVTGSHHMQVYWYETGYHRLLGQVPFIYLKDEARWIPRGSAFLAPPGLLRNAEVGRWNHTCLNCHTTHGQPRLGPQDEPDTQVAEFGIACEACHGPGQAHVERHRSPLARYRLHFGGGGARDIVQPGKLGARRASEVCSQCHGLWQLVSDEAGRRWRTHGHAFRPGGEQVDRWMFQPTRRGEQPAVDRIMREMPAYVAGQFWPDGLARVSSREYNAMIDSPCYERGELSCLSCHSLHKRADDPRSHAQWADDQLGAGKDGNGACVQCHEQLAPARALRAHTLHAPEGSGSSCYNCHMPHTSYGLLKAIRSHTVTSPEVGSSRGAGRPNACNLCHLDRSLGWTAGQLQARHGIERPELDADEAEVPAAVLWALRGDAAQRALIAWSMGWEPARQASGQTWLAPLLGALLDDRYDAVRIVAWRALRKLPGFADFAYDPVPAPDRREPAGPRVAARLRELARAPLRAPAGVIDGAFELDPELAARLLRARDERDVHLLE